VFFNTHGGLAEQEQRLLSPFSSSVILVIGEGIFFSYGYRCLLGFTCDPFSKGDASSITVAVKVGLLGSHHHTKSYPSIHERRSSSMGLVLCWVIIDDDRETDKVYFVCCWMVFDRGAIGLHIMHT